MSPAVLDGLMGADGLAVPGMFPAAGRDARAQERQLFPRIAKYHRE